MPLYNFICNGCDKEYEKLTAFDKSGKYKKIDCPYCGSKDKDKLLSMCNHAFSNPVGTDKWTSDNSGHDYRFKHNIPNVQKERETAEALSHMGSDPYGQADMASNDIELDTGIHDAGEGPAMMTDYGS
jgi:putative FmdB family regulatory protein